MDGKLRNMTSVYLLKGEKILLLYRQGSRVVNNVWIGSAGGHFENHELNDAKACALRELYEELGIEDKHIEGLELRYITLRYLNGEIRQNYYFFAKLKEAMNDNLNSNEGVCRWFQLSEVDTLEMPFTAKYVINHFVTMGRHTNKLYADIANAEKVDFLEMQEF